MYIEFIWGGPGGKARVGPAVGEAHEDDATWQRGAVIVSHPSRNFS